MKKNVLLFAVLLILIALTWVFQEKRTEREYVESRSKGKLVIGEIKRLKLPSLEAVKREGQWWSGDQLLSHNSLTQLEKMLLAITNLKAIQGDPKDFFHDSTSFELNGEPWIIGGMSMDKRGFYVSKSAKIFLGFIDAESGQVSHEGESIEEKKLDELRSLLSRRPVDFKEIQFFRYYRKLPFENAVIEAEGNLAYELFLNEDKTSPPPIPGIGVHKQLNEKFLSVITQMMIKDEVPYSEKLKFRKMASMTLKGTGEEKVTWQLWLKSKNSADVFIVDDKQKRAFLMVGGSLRPFFLNVQDYWDKKVIPSAYFKSFERLPAVFREGAKEAVVTVIDREPLDFEVKGYKVKPGNMQDLFQLIFNLGPMDQAGRVSQLTKSEKQQYLNGSNLRIEVMEQELVCIRKTDELILVNLTQGFKAHFIGPPENLRCRFTDVLE